MNRGDVWWVDDPDAGRRPHLVLTRKTAVPVLNVLICVPATRSVRGIATEVHLSREEGMPDDCVLSLDNVTLVPKEFLVERICTLRGDRMHEVCEALAIATGCD